MSTRNLERIFEPKSIAVIGASPRPGSLGLMVLRNLISGGFSGSIFPVNPNHQQIEGYATYKSVADLPSTPDMAVICTPAAAIPELVGELGTRGTRGAVILSASEEGVGAGAWRQKILAAAQPHLVRIVGPNCVGILSPSSRLNASFAHISAREGNIAFVTQSGAVLTTVLDWAEGRGIGFSHLVSLGDMADVDFGDMLDFLASDRKTRAVFLYVEGITHARKFMSAARACARIKPVVIIKAGRHQEAAKAAQSHTGALAGSDAVYDAAFRRAGILRVQNLEDVFDALETLSLAPEISGDRLAIVTNGGGMGVLATDALLDRGGHLASLSEETLAKLNSVLPPRWSHANPVDLIGDADRARYQAALDIVLADPGVDCTLVIHCPVAVSSGEDCARGVVEASRNKIPVLTNWLGNAAATTSRAIFHAGKLPTFETPDDAVAGFMQLVDYRHAQAALMEVPAAMPTGFRPDRPAAAAVIADGLAKNEWLAPHQVTALFNAYEIPCVRSELAVTLDDVVKLAPALNFPIALKIVSPDIIHKSDVGGVILNLPDAQSVMLAARAMRDRIKTAKPNAQIEGFLLQEMANRPLAHELILGMAVDPTFGPVLLIGQGGTAVEVINDKALGLPPLNLPLARQLLARTRMNRQLQGYRQRPAADIDAIALTLVKLSQLIIDHEQIVELDINPLLADERGVLCVDARVRLSEKTMAKPHARLAILPYPDDLEQRGNLPAVGDYILRPIRPDDAPRFLEFAEHLSGEDIRFRFMSSKRHLLPSELARLTQIDYDREMALILVERNLGRIAGIARLISDSEGHAAEFAVITRTDMKQCGVGKLLVSALLRYARQRGLHLIFGDVMRDNTAMLAFSRRLGFTTTRHTDPQTVRVEKTLGD